MPTNTNKPLSAIITRFEEIFALVKNLQLQVSARQFPQPDKAIPIGSKQVPTSYAIFLQERMGRHTLRTTELPTSPIRLEVLKRLYRKHFMQLCGLMHAAQQQTNGSELDNVSQKLIIAGKFKSYYNEYIAKLTATDTPASWEELEDFYALLKVASAEYPGLKNVAGLKSKVDQMLNQKFSSSDEEPYEGKMGYR